MKIANLDQISTIQLIRKISKNYKYHIFRYATDLLQRCTRAHELYNRPCTRTIEISTSILFK